MGNWAKHPKKELQSLLKEFDEAGWRIQDPPKYYKVYCPCGAHKRTIHLTPSDPNYTLNASKWLHRQECYTQEGASNDNDQSHDDLQG